MIRNKLPFLVKKSGFVASLFAASLEILLLPSAANGAEPQAFSLKILSSDLDDSQIPLINGDNVLWIGTQGSEGDVYRYYIPTASRTILTTNSANPAAIAMDGNYAAWEAAGISLYNFSIGATSTLSSEPRSSSPKISGKFVLWQEGREQDSQSRIMLYNVETMGTQQILGFGERNNVRISGNDIVWDQRTGSAPITAEIFHYNLLSNSTTRLTSNSIPDVFPELSAGNVVWQTFDGETTAEIFRRNLQSGITERITNNSEPDRFPQISGPNLVWQGGGAGGSINNVFYRNLATGITMQLTFAAAYPEEYGMPRISDSSIAWSGKSEVGSNSAEIFFHSLADGITSPVTNNAFREENAAVFGAKVVFHRERPFNTNRWDVVLAMPIPEPSAATLIGVAGLFFLQVVSCRRSRILAR